MRTIELGIHQGDIAAFRADAVALAYTQASSGVDGGIADQLARAGLTPGDLRPAPGDDRVIATQGALPWQYVIIMGVTDRAGFAYPQIRQFAQRVLATLAAQAPGVRHLAMTMHGPGYGLDETEALLAQIAGYRDAIGAGQVPPALERISIVERDSGRVARLHPALESHLDGARDVVRLPGNVYHLAVSPPAFLAESPAPYAIAQDTAKPHAFVAMPFRREMEDVFYYGIQPPVHQNGFLCERADSEAFTGDLLAHVQRKIATASVVIVDLTGDSANVYLELGYAWGKDRPAILLAREGEPVMFNVRGQRCLFYASIRHLEGMLHQELRGLKVRGVI